MLKEVLEVFINWIGGGILWGTIAVALLISFIKIFPIQFLRVITFLNYKF